MSVRKTQMSNLEAISQQVGAAAQQGAMKALQNVSSINVARAALAGGYAGLNRLASSGISGTPVVPLGAVTRNAAGTRVIFASNGAPVTDERNVTTLSGPRDSRNRLYVLKSDYTPPGGIETPEEIAAQEAARDPYPTTGDAFRDAYLYGPEALRFRPVLPVNVTIPIETRPKPVDDGVVPVADKKTGRVFFPRVTKAGAEGWPAGIIIEDRSKYGPEGALAVDTIPVSSVSTSPPVSTTDSNPWPMRTAVGAGLLLLLALAVGGAMSESDHDDGVEESDAKLKHVLISGAGNAIKM